MVYAVLGAVLVGVTLGMLGSGGSILTVPVLVYLVQRPRDNAIVESLAIVGVIALSGALTRLGKREVDPGAAAMFALASVPGAYLGTLIGAFLPGAAQLVMLAATMLAAAALMLRGSASRSNVDPPTHTGARKRRPGVVIPAGLGVGALTGMVGVGGGFLFVPALTIAAGLEIRRAIGTSLLLIAINCAAGLLGYLTRAHALPEPIDWATVAVFGGVGIAGGLVGQRLGGRVRRKTLSRLFAAFLIVLGGYMLWRESASLLRAQNNAGAAKPTTTDVSCRPRPSWTGGCSDRRC